MSDTEEENFCFYGKPLPPYDEDTIPKKKPISVEEQIATDAQGRRRFHGAFTGGFSAGFFNTVGSLEGWLPSEFKSTRGDKSKSKTQKPEDFMDDEDLGEFGIAPQTVRATSDYSTSRKRKRQIFNEGPIPGEPVLHSLLTSGNETIGYLLLRNMGAKGKSTEESREESMGRVYGCEMPKTYEISREEHVDCPIQAIYLSYLKTPKDNSFGLGYQGLDKSHVNLFNSTKLVVNEKNKKKLSITGQAFGVGAFEDDDEDIYVKDDMTRYDFELTGEKATRKDTTPKKETILDDFIPAKTLLIPKQTFAPPTIPHSFTGKHKMKRSRFEPLEAEEAPKPQRREMNAELRARYLGEEIVPIPAPKVPEPKKPEPETVKEPVQQQEPKLFSVASSNLVFDRFVSASTAEDLSNILEVVEKSTTDHGTQEMRDAARMKMFGPLTRISIDWQPCSLLCKRFNVPEPQTELQPNKTRKKMKNLIFEYEQFTDTVPDLKPGLSIKPEESAQGETEAPEEKIEPEESIVEEKTAEPPPVLDMTDKIDVDKNLDLYKAVFLSSSESEDEDDRQEQPEQRTDFKSTILTESLLPKIKPLKDGILSNMDFTIFQEKQHEVQVIEEKTPDSELYGPSLPSNLLRSSGDVLGSKLLVHDTEKWVEKSKKHKKKHKSKKSSHKKRHKQRD